MQLIIENLSLLTRLVGKPLPVETLLVHSPVAAEQKGYLNFTSLVEFLKSEGLENRITKRELSSIPKLALPVLLILHNEESAVLTKIETRKNDEGQEQNIFFLTQLDGLHLEVTEQELQEQYLGYCWFIKPKVQADISSDLPEYHLPKAWFLKVVWRFKHYYAQVVLATILINFLALVSSLYVMNVYDRVIPNKAYQTLWVLSIGVVLAITFEFFSKILRGRLTDIAGKKADLIISAGLFRRVLSLRLQDRPASAGSYASNLRDFESVREFMTSASLLTLVDLPFLLLFLSVLYLIAGKLVIVPAVIMVLVILIGLIAQFPLHKYINESMRESSQRSGLAVEAIDGLETLKTNNAYQWAQSRWDHFTAKTAKSQMKVKDISNFVIFSTMSLQQLNTVLLVIFGTYLIHDQNPADRITMGALIASVILSGRALAPLGQIAGLMVRFQQAMLALKGANGIAERPIERDPSVEYLSLERTHGKIHFNGATFSYQEGLAPAVNGLNLTINEGEKVAILGKVGSGKSTALKLAAGLYQPTQGQVTFDDIDELQIDPIFLRSQVCLLEQKPRFFLGTLRDNLEMARRDSFATNQDLLRALQRFDLLPFIQSHPKGINMPVGADGLGLSGGQKQMLALARMTLRDPKVVLLDEPTSGLDQGSEIRALQALRNWVQGRTLVVVTHRPQVLQLVDRIVVMDNGKVTIDGPRDKVLQYLREQETKKAQSPTNANSQTNKG